MEHLPFLVPLAGAILLQASCLGCCVFRTNRRVRRLEENQKTLHDELLKMEMGLQRPQQASPFLGGYVISGATPWHLSRPVQGPPVPSAPAPWPYPQAPGPAQL